MIIVGAGYAGLISGVMLRNLYDLEIHESQDALPNNHTAILRFRTPNVSNAINMPFRKVPVLRCASPWKNPVADALAYSRKVIGECIIGRSISDIEPKVVDRWVPPTNMRKFMENILLKRIQFGQRWHPNEHGTKRPIISTMPMPLLMESLRYTTEVKFKYYSSINYVLPVVPSMGIRRDTYCTVYIPDPARRFSRISVQHNKIVCEYFLHPRMFDATAISMNKGHHEDGLFNSAGHEIASALGINVAGRGKGTFHYRKVAKILPVDNDKRLDFIRWATSQHNVYSLGRYATWRPGLLLDDIPGDVRKITRMIYQGNYTHGGER